MGSTSSTALRCFICRAEYLPRFNTKLVQRGGQWFRIWVVVTKKAPSDDEALWTQRGMIPRPSDYESAALTD